MSGKRKFSKGQKVSVPFEGKVLRYCHKLVYVEIDLGEGASMKVFRYPRQLRTLQPPAARRRKP